MVIRVKSIVDMAFSYEDGMKLREKISNALQSNANVTVDFSDIYVFTTMFFNACSGHFVFTHSLSWYNEKINVINLSPIGIETHKHSIENAQKRQIEQASEITQKTIDDNS